MAEEGVVLLELPSVLHLMSGLKLMGLSKCSEGKHASGRIRSYGTLDKNRLSGRLHRNQYDDPFTWVRFD